MVMHYVGLPDVEAAQLVALDRLGFMVQVTRQGQTFKLRLPFPRAAADRKDVKSLIVEMTQAAVGSARLGSARLGSASARPRLGSARLGSASRLAISTSPSRLAHLGPSREDAAAAVVPPTSPHLSLRRRLTRTSRCRPTWRRSRSPRRARRPRGPSFAARARWGVTSVAQRHAGSGESEGEVEKLAHRHIRVP